MLSSELLVKHGGQHAEQIVDGLVAAIVLGERSENPQRFLDILSPTTRRGEHFADIRAIKRTTRAKRLDVARATIDDFRRRGHATIRLLAFNQCETRMAS